MSRGEDLYSFLLLPRRDPGPESYGGVGPESSGGVWGLKSLGFEGPRAVWSVWVVAFLLRSMADGQPTCDGFLIASER